MIAALLAAHAPRQSRAARGASTGAPWRREFDALYADMVPVGAARRSETAAPAPAREQEDA